jgi:transposase
MLGIARSTVHDTRKKFSEEGLKKALFDATHPGKARKLTGEQEAQVVAIACTDAPKGYVRWTMDLLTREVNKQLPVPIGRTAVYAVLLRNDTKPWLKKNVVHPESNS